MEKRGAREEGEEEYDTGRAYRKKKMKRRRNEEEENRGRGTEPKRKGKKKKTSKSKTKTKTKTETKTKRSKKKRKIMKEEDELRNKCHAKYISIVIVVKSQFYCYLSILQHLFFHSPVEGVIFMLFIDNERTILYMPVSLNITWRMVPFFIFASVLENIHKKIKLNWWLIMISSIKPLKTFAF